MNETHVLLKLLLTNITNEQRSNFYDYMNRNGWERHESVETVWSYIDTKNYNDILLKVNQDIQNSGIGEYKALLQIGNNKPVEL